jgi:hypothetical protein
MLFGVREICNVVFKAKANQKIGNRVFYKDEPVIYFDSLKTSSLEGASTTVYAQGGRGNSRLIAWEGERTLTFTMEDALISPIGISILTGAGIVEAKKGNLKIIEEYLYSEEFFQISGEQYPLVDRTLTFKLSHPAAIDADNIGSTFDGAVGEVTISNGFSDIDGLNPITTPYKIHWEDNVTARISGPTVVSGFS